MSFRPKHPGRGKPTPVRGAGVPVSTHHVRQPPPLGFAGCSSVKLGSTRGRNGHGATVPAVWEEPPFAESRTLMQRVRENSGAQWRREGAGVQGAPLSSRMGPQQFLSPPAR